jgi:uncharacterized membrane protein YraQ (UPF0718 family)
MGLEGAIQLVILIVIGGVIANWITLSMVMKYIVKNKDKED